MLPAVHTRALMEREIVYSLDGIDLTVKTFNAGKVITEMKVVAPCVISEVGKEGGFEILAFAFLDPGSGIWCVPTLRES